MAGTAKNSEQIKRLVASLALERESHQSLSSQLVHAMASEIRGGRLRPGEHLPSTRRLARELDVHRNTVVAAFEELIAQGWLETTPGSHTRVTTTLPLVSLSKNDSDTNCSEERPIGFAFTPHRNSARSFEALPRDLLDFTGGLPDARLFPAEVLARAFRRTLRRSAGALLDFGEPAGDRRLRTCIAEMLHSERGLQVSADEIFVSRGSQFALHLLSLALVGPNDKVAVESPGYPSAREAFGFLGATIVPIAVDGEGLDVDALARYLEHDSIRALYITPQHQDPTTVALSARRRLALLALARQHRFAIIEGDYDFDLQFDGPPLLPLAESDRDGMVVYVGSLTKALAPGLRLGFIVAPKPLLDTLVALRGQIDRQGDHALERAIAELLSEGELIRHAVRAKRVYQARRDHLVELLQARLPGVLSFEVPRGGLALWVRVADEIDLPMWFASCLQAGVRFMLGRHYDPEGRELPFLRLGFAHLDEGELCDAVDRMVSALPRSCA